MTSARSPRPAPPLATDRSDLSAGSLRFGHGVKFLSVCIIVAAALSACSKRESTKETTAPRDGGGGDAASDDIDALERELDAREQQLAALRGQPAGGDIAAGSGGGQAVGRDTNARAEKKATAESEAQGVPAPTSSAPTIAPEPPMRDGPQDRCTTVCELSAAICGLQDRICDLAPRHPNEPRYQAACQRAARDCETSQEACHACP